MEKKMTKEEQLIEFLKRPDIEGCKLTAYLDSAGIATIGVGTTRRPDGTHVQLGDVCTQQQADDWLIYHLQFYVYPIVNNAINPQCPSNVWIALCSFIYNEGHFGESILKALATDDLNAVAASFRLYNKITINGNLEVCQGLVNRREKEIELFLPKKES